MCSDQSPWAIDENTAYGWAAVNIAGETEMTWCCACYELTFTSGPVSGKKLIVQASNTGDDLSTNQFDLAIPGGGVGQFNACTDEWGAPPEGWGQQYGGISSRSDCDSFPDALEAGCYWRFDWFEGANNPDVTFQQVACPAALVAKSGCSRNNDSINESPTGPSSLSTWTPTSTAAGNVFATGIFKM
ncbi:RlpA-like double-psi beta-barrel-protein domain-containing protein-containing protein [Xylariaceae sp. FL0255]|nr:RlpA-like double-psi beta-barrel-protein domain-containing protein-containing protein [Xylariaceae sp. FL0255]